MALSLALSASPVPPPKRVDAYTQKATHIKKVQPAVTPAPSPQPEPFTQPETPPAAPAPVATPPPAPTPQCVTGFTVADYYENLVMQRESGGQSCVTNYLGCVGLFQACPGSKLYAACPTLDVDCQLSFFTNYMLAIYGSWANAWNSEVTRGWW